MNIKKTFLIFNNEKLAVLLIGLLLSLPFVIWGYPGVGDSWHHFRLAIGFYDSTLTGDLYPSWLAMTNGGMGDPSVRFYPPGLYFSFSVFRVVTGDWFLAAFFTFVLLTAVGSFGAYLYARTLTQSRYAILAALIWPLMPFHANELYQAGMYGQYAATCFVPFVFAFVEKICRKQTLTNVALFALSFAGVILFHVPMAIFTTIAVGVYLLVRSFQLKPLIYLFFGGFLGAAITCFYWLPVFLEVDWKFPSGAGQGEWFNYKNNFIFTILPGEMANYWIPALIGVSALLLVPAGFGAFRSKQKMLPAAILAVMTFVFATELSKPVWDMVPTLQETQFPWRWLTLTSLFLTVLSVEGLASLSSFWQTRLRPVALLIAGVLAIVLAFTVSQVIRSSIYIDAATFNQRLEALRGTKTNQDFLPIWAKRISNNAMADVETPRKVEVLEWAPEHKRFRIEAGTQTDATVKLYYYPHWKATSQNLALKTRPDDEGKLVVEIPPEEATVSVDFVEPPSSFAATIVSCLGLIICVVLIIFDRKRSGVIET